MRGTYSRSPRWRRPGGLPFGYDRVVLGGAKPFYEKFFMLTSEQDIGWANSCALLGCLLVLIAEIFPNRVRGAAVSVAVSALWIGCLLVTFTFPVPNRALGPAGAFWLYSAICAAGFVFVWLRVSETKGKTLEQIERDYVGEDHAGA